MNCNNCPHYYYNEVEQEKVCNANPDWPAPCEQEPAEEIPDSYTLADLGNNWW